MQENVTLRLKTFLRETIRAYSDNSRECNYNNNSFTLKKPEHLFCEGEYNVIAILTKDDDLQTMFTFEYIPQKQRWEHRVKTSTQVMSALQLRVYQQVETHNLRERWKKWS